MKVAVSSTGGGVGDSVDQRLGRCAWFVVVDTETAQVDAFENPNGALGSGAGIQTAQMLASKGIDAILTGNCGPNAFAALDAAGIRVCIGISGSVAEAVERFRKGDVESTLSPNVGSHFGMGTADNASQ